jgi:hypothetical protein
MPVVVVQADADDSDARAHGGEEPEIGVCRAVVRHLQDVGPQIGAGREEFALRVELGVAGQQDAYTVHDRAHHE